MLPRPDCEPTLATLCENVDQTIEDAYQSVSNDQVHVFDQTRINSFPSAWVLDLPVMGATGFRHTDDWRIPRIKCFLPTGFEYKRLLSRLSAVGICQVSGSTSPYRFALLYLNYRR